MVEIENRHAKCWEWIGRELSLLELSLPWVLENFRAFCRRYDDIDSTVIVVVGADCANRGSTRVQPRRVGHVRKNAIPVISPHGVAGRVLSEEGYARIKGKLMVPIESRDIKIQVAIVVIVNERQTENKSVGMNAGGSSCVLEGAVLFVVLQQQTAIESND